MNTHTTMNGRGQTPQHETHVRIERSAIAERAYELWLAKGRPPGRDLEFWLQAEAELLAASQGRSHKAGAAATGRERESLPAGLRHAEVETPGNQGVSAKGGVRLRQEQAPATQAGQSAKSHTQTRKPTTGQVK